MASIDDTLQVAPASASTSSSPSMTKRVLRSATQPARHRANRLAVEKRQRRQVLFGKLHTHVQLLGARLYRLRRIANQHAAWTAYKASFVCGACGAATDMIGANVCGICTRYKIDSCFGCRKELQPTTRTWIAQCRDNGIFYRDTTYKRACVIPGTDEIGSGTVRYSGPTDDSHNGFEGPIPVRRYAFYALARWQNPWREDARRRPKKDGDCTRWKPTHCPVPGSREEMRRLPYCATCALALERDHQGSPMIRWNGWQTGGWREGYEGHDPYTPLTTAAQLHFC